MRAYIDAILYRAYIKPLALANGFEQRIGALEPLAIALLKEPDAVSRRFFLLTFMKIYLEIFYYNVRRQDSSAGSTQGC